MEALGGNGHHERVYSVTMWRIMYIEVSYTDLQVEIPYLNITVVHGGNYPRFDRMEAQPFDPRTLDLHLEGKHCIGQLLLITLFGHSLK